MASLPFQEESHRVASFLGWKPVDGVSCLALARSGFYYSGTEHDVMCWSCKKLLNIGEVRDKFKSFHRRCSPDCPELTVATSANIPLQLPDYCINVRGTTETDDGVKRSVFQLLLESINLRAARHGVFERKTKISLDDPDFDLLRRELLRLHTFRHWPSAHCTKPDDLARAGFFYTGAGDQVRCAFCRNVKADWMPLEVPIEEHRRCFPVCPFVCENHAVCANIPSEEDVLEEEIELVGFGSLSNALPTAPSPYIHDGGPMVALNARELSDVATDKAGAGSCGVKPKHPQMSSVRERQETFYAPGAVVPNNQNPEILAEAGFYYYGPSDLCRCFFCGGGVREWQPDDDPWFEHAKFYPHCAYVRDKKGIQFITDAQDTKAETSLSGASLSVPSHMQTSQSLPLSLASSGSTSGPLLPESKCTRPNITESLPSAGSQKGANAEELKQSTVSTKKKNKKKKKKSSGATFISGAQAVHQETEEFQAVAAATNSENVVDLVGDLEIYQQENRLLKDATTCKVCRQNEVNAVFLPCGHLVSCEGCVSTLRMCMICRTIIRGTVKTFLV